MVFMDLENIRKHNIQNMCAANLSFQLAQKKLESGTRNYNGTLCDLVIWSI